jgi:hypothetical protein
MSSHSTDESYITRDMDLACWLHFQDHPLLGIVWENGFARWRFEPSPKLYDDIRIFNRDEALVNPKTFFSEVSEFKKMMWESQPQT